jgi:hypothetical protein
MATYNEAKLEADKEIARLEQCLKDVRKDYTYDFTCLQCKETTQVSIFSATQGSGKIYCGTDCRSKAYRDRHMLPKTTRKELIEIEEKRNKRRAEIVKLKNDGLTFKEIGEKFNTSRQRAQQIYCRANEIHQLSLSNDTRRKV